MEKHDFDKPHPEKEPEKIKETVRAKRLKAVNGIEGMVMTVGSNNLTIAANPAAERETHIVPSVAEVTLNGDAVKLWDLKSGDTVTLRADENGVTKIEAKRPKPKKSD